jgi:hypothetical protein
MVFSSSIGYVTFAKSRSLLVSERSPEFFALATAVVGIVSFYTDLVCGITLLIGFKLGAYAQRDELPLTSTISEVEPVNMHQAVQMEVTYPEKSAEISNEQLQEPSSNNSPGNLHDSLTLGYKAVELDDLGGLENYLYDNKPYVAEPVAEFPSPDTVPSDLILEAAMKAVIKLHGDYVPATCTSKFTYRAPKRSAYDDSRHGYFCDRFAPLHYAQTSGWLHAIERGAKGR